MLGKVVRQQKSPEKPKVSTKLRDALLESWTEQRDAFVPTLMGEDNPADAWKEFWLYASGTKKWCPRMTALLALSNEVKGEPFDAETLWNFGQGNAMHSLFQDDAMQSLGAQFLGSWERVIDSGVQRVTGQTLVRQSTDFKNDIPDGHELVRGWGPKPLNDNLGDWQYREAKVRMPGIRVVVKFDGVVDWGGDFGLEIQEFKTEKSDARDQLDPMVGGKARVQHVEQVMLAMEATGIHRARITYIFKGAVSLRSSLLEHEIVYDPDMVNRLKIVAKECVQAVKLVDNMKADNPNGIQLFTDDSEKALWMDEHFPRLPECPMKSKGNARYCGARDACFPAGYRKKK